MRQGNYWRHCFEDELKMMRLRLRLEGKRGKQYKQNMKEKKQLNVKIIKWKWSNCRFGQRFCIGGAFQQVEMWECFCGWSITILKMGQAIQTTTSSISVQRYQIPIQFPYSGPFCWDRADPLNFETIRSGATPRWPIWGVSEPFRVNWNLGVSFRKDPKSFHIVWAILHPFESNTVHFRTIRVDLITFRAISINSFVLSRFVVIPICFVPFRAKLYSFHLFLSCRFVVELL